MKLEDLSDQDRAFVALIEGFYVQAEALKVAFPEGRHNTALTVLQMVLTRLAAASVEQDASRRQP